MTVAGRWITLSLGVGVVVGATQACVLKDPKHCENSLDPCQNPDQVCDPCTPSNVTENEDGCVNATDVVDEDLVAGGCQGGPGSTSVSATVGEESTDSTVGPMTMSTMVDVDTTATDGNTDTTATTGPPPACAASDGTYLDMCPPSDPFCVGGECTACSDDGEFTMCPDSLVCDPSGACVVCTAEDPSACGGDTPVCDTVTNMCVPCTEHDECGSAACNLFTGACVGGMVVTVGAGQNYPTLAAAAAAVAGGGGGTIIVHAGTYNESVTIDGGAIVAFLSNPGDEPEWQRTTGAGAPQLRSTGSATVLTDGIDFRGNTSVSDPAIRVDGGSAWVDRGAIAQNASVAVLAETSGVLRLRNSFVGGAVDLAALRSESNSVVTIQYTTIGAGTGDASAVVCIGGGQLVSSDSVVLSRGLPAAAVDCPVLTADHTVANTMLAGTDNVDVGATMTTWFQGYNTGDFHLSASGEMIFENRAEWNDGDPRVDIDGDSRSGVNGTPEHAGADLP